MMRLSLRDPDGKELDGATACDGKDAPAEAIMMLARHGAIYPGSLLSFDDDRPRRDPGICLTVTAANLAALAKRLEQRAAVITPA